MIENDNETEKENGRDEEDAGVRFLPPSVLVFVSQPNTVSEQIIQIHQHMVLVSYQEL